MIEEIKFSTATHEDVSVDLFEDAQACLRNCCGKIVNLTLNDDLFRRGHYASDVKKNGYSVLVLNSNYQYLCQIPQFEYVFSNILRKSPVRIVSTIELRSFEDEDSWGCSLECPMSVVSKVIEDVSFDFQDLANNLSLCLDSDVVDWSNNLGEGVMDIPATICTRGDFEVKDAMNFADSLFQEMIDSSASGSSIVPSDSHGVFLKFSKMAKPFLNLVDMMTERVLPFQYQVSF